MKKLETKTWVFWVVAFLIIASLIMYWARESFVIEQNTLQES